jgi:hypothetical protein
MTRPVALLLLLFAADLCHAKSVSTIYRGSQLLQFCESTAAVEKAHCEGYLGGVATALADPQMSKVRLCLPEGATHSQLRLIYVKFARDNPQILHYAASATAAFAFEKAFPCR